MKQRKIFLAVALIILGVFSGEEGVSAEKSSDSSLSTIETTTQAKTTHTTQSESVMSNSTENVDSVSNSSTTKQESTKEQSIEQTASIFDSAKLYSYPLGVGTEFTAFAGGTITVGYQNTTGFMGANTINAVNDWPSLFTPNLPGGLAIADSQEHISLVANSINDNLAKVLSKENMFTNQQIIVKQGTVPVEKKSVHQADELQSFVDNGIHSEDWQNTTKTNLNKVSSQYQALTKGTGIALSDAAIQASQQVSFDNSTNKQVHQLTVDLSQYTKTIAPIVIFDVEQIQSNDSYVVNFKKGSSNVLPYIILNWKNAGTFTWGWNNTLTISGDATISELGNRMIHSFLNAENVSIVASKFYGAIIAAQGNISVGEAGLDLLHSSYVAGGDIDIKSQLTLEQAAANQFDKGNWTGQQVPSQPENKEPSITLIKDGETVPEKLQLLQGQPLHIDVKTANYDGQQVEEAIDSDKFVVFSKTDGINLDNLSVGKHVLTVRLPDHPDIEAQVIIIVSGYLTLDEVPDFQFGSKDLKQFTETPSYQLVDGNITRGKTEEDKDQLTVKVTDNRYAEQQTPWSLSVQLSPFSDGKSEIMGRLSFVSDSGEEGLLNGEVLSNQKWTFNKKGSSSLTGSLSEKLSTKTSLGLNDQTPEPGTYQGKLSWTLSNAPQ